VHRESLKKNSHQLTWVGHQPADSSLAKNMNTAISDRLSPSSANTGSALSHEEIATRADLLWRQKGCPQGCDEKIWLEAERELSRLQPLQRDETKKMEHADPGLKFTRIENSLMGELDERFPETTGKETTSL
jgi:hypothetical protein